jgi:4-hydroxy-tetrahydrodipicolinate reductase
MTTTIAISGAGGRMGRRLLALAAADEALELVQAVEAEGHALLSVGVGTVVPEVRADIAFRDALAAGADACVDFSTPESTRARAGEAARHGTALVVGTTGLDEGTEAALDEAAKSVPVLLAPNFSLGVNLLFRIAAEVARALGEDYNIEIVESHHKRKADAPSGTALGIARAICAATGRDPETDLVHGRSGRPGERSAREIGMHALRLGGVIGEHTAHFGSEFERVEITHRAETRDVFAAGALRAAKWLHGKDPGRYGMADVLFG